MSDDDIETESEKNAKRLKLIAVSTSNYELPNGFQTKAPKWLEQKNYVEVWVKKQNMAPDVRKALKGRHVVIAPNRGSVSITFIHQNIERLIDQFIEHKREKVYVLYLGDLDPDGWDMDRRAIEDLTRQTKENLSDEELTDEQGDARFVFKRIGLTDEHIKKFKKIRDLKQTDPDTLKKYFNKFGKLTNVAQRFKQEFGSVFQIELEAFQLLPFTTFQKIITDKVDKLYDDTVHGDVLKRPEYSQKPRVIKDQIIGELNSLVDTLTVRTEDEEEEE